MLTFLYRQIWLRGCERGLGISWVMQLRCSFYSFPTLHLYCLQFLFSSCDQGYLILCSSFLSWHLVFLLPESMETETSLPSHKRSQPRSGRPAIIDFHVRCSLLLFMHLFCWFLRCGFFSWLVSSFLRPFSLSLLARTSPIISVCSFEVVDV